MQLRGGERVLLGPDDESVERATPASRVRFTDVSEVDFVAVRPPEVCDQARQRCEER